MRNFMKIHPVGHEILQAEGQADVTKLILPFKNFVNATYLLTYLHNYLLT